MVCYDMSGLLLIWYVALYCVIFVCLLSCFISWYLILYHIRLCYVVLWFVVLCHFVVRYALSCCVTLCHVKSCCIVSWYVVSTLYFTPLIYEHRIERSSDDLVFPRTCKHINLTMSRSRHEINVDSSCQARSNNILYSFSLSLWMKVNTKFIWEHTQA